MPHIIFGSTYFLNLASVLLQIIYTRKILFLWNYNLALDFDINLYTFYINDIQNIRSSTIRDTIQD